MNKVKIATPVHAVYDANGKLITSNVKKVPKEDKIDNQIPVPVPEKEKDIQKKTMYLIDSWILKGHKLNIVGVYDDTGGIQGGMFIADHDGTPSSMLNPEEEKTILFYRLCEVLNIPTQI